ncbi:hypothetical protein CEXT_194971 [Caerostris extrusa]|uniref:Uncharacterized protein n=1 Tax=Caerostris extrusa TaxID=172846 RepID=A0AAV4M9D9_CAEEX|nr:hypothetical protein CEXT_194971 [Caerostris extrusa]
MCSSNENCGTRNKTKKTICNSSKLVSRVLFAPKIDESEQVDNSGHLFPPSFLPHPLATFVCATNLVQVISRKPEGGNGEGWRIEKTKRSKHHHQH